MLAFYFKSLSFKLPLVSPKLFHVKIEIAEGTPRTTETIMYFPRTNLAVLSETLEFTVKHPQENTYFNIEIYEDYERSPEKPQRICRETIHMNKVCINSNELTLPTTYGTAIIDLALEFSEEFRDILSAQGKPLPRDKTKRREEALNMDNLNIFKMAPLMHEFIYSLSPLVFLKAQAIDFFTWKNPHKTALCSILFSVGLLFNQTLWALGLLLFFIFNKKIIPVIIQTKLPEDEVKGTINIYKRNMVMMRELMQVTVWVDEMQNKLLNDPDKTLFLHLLLMIKNFAPLLAILVYFGDIRILILTGFWTILAYNTFTGKKVITSSYSLFSDMMDHVDALFLPAMNLDKKLLKGHLTLKRSSSTSSSFSSHSSEISKNVDNESGATKQNIIRQKTFVTYENQRWWLGKGWCQKMLPDERPSWSDDLGQLKLS